MVSQRSGTLMLIAAAALVGVAIALDGSLARVVNGVGGLLWFASTAVLILVGVRMRPPVWLWGVLAIVTIVVAFVVTPSAAVSTLVGFIPAGFLMSAVGSRSRLLWATLVPACYLPAHIGTAVIRAGVRTMLGSDAPLRTDPPPTAALVPLLMVVCALAGGFLAMQIMSRRAVFEAK